MPSDSPISFLPLDPFTKEFLKGWFKGILGNDDTQPVATTGRFADPVLRWAPELPERAQQYGTKSDLYRTLRGFKDLYPWSTQTDQQRLANAARVFLDYAIGNNITDGANLTALALGAIGQEFADGTLTSIYRLVTGQAEAVDTAETQRRNSEVARLTSELNAALEAARNGTSADVETIARRVASAITVGLGDRGFELDDIVGTITGIIDGSLSDSDSLASSIVNAITRTIGIGTGTSNINLHTTIDILTAPVTQSIAGIAGFSAVTQDRIATFAEGAIDEYGDIVFKTQEQLNRAFQKAIDSGETVYTNTANKIGAAAEVAIESVRSTSSGIAESVVGAVSRGIEIAAGIASSRTPDLDDITNALERVRRAIAVDGPLATGQGVGAGILEIVNGVLNPGNYLERLQKTILGDVPDNTDLIDDILDFSHEDCRNLIHNAMQQSKWLRIVVNAVTLVAFPVLFLIKTAQQKTEPCVDEWNTRNPWQKIGIADASLAERYGLIDDGELRRRVKMHGFSDADASIIEQLSRTLPTVDNVLTMWNRGIVDDKTMVETIRKQGFNDEWIGRFTTLSKIVPPVSDLITMTVRDVFSPSVVTAFGLMDDFPEDVVPYLEQQGVSREWAMRYWGSHWTLPSMTMGFEMFQRDIIDDETLKLLMRTHDIMPFWRDKLLKLNYNPLTRVDIRRMHQVGVLNESEVKRAYLDIGYSPENAKRLTDFTVKLNAESGDNKVTDIDDLSRANIVGFYVDGVLSRATAFTLLLNAGYTAVVAELFLDDADLKEQRRDRKDEIDLILAQAESGSMSFGEAQDALARAGLETAERAKAEAKLARLSQTRNKIPGLPDLAKMLNAGILDRAGYLDAVQRSGYSRTWAEKLADLNEGKDDERLQ